MVKSKTSKVDLQAQTEKFREAGEEALSIMRSYRGADDDGYPCIKCDVVTIGRCVINQKTDCHKFKAYEDRFKAT